ncbi:MAG: hypothetical protein Ct9H300mP31_18560 [Acidimicrobiaceae bacterium]|nr:MAG: hypothetical protein Ct9H300mP31_18560 [Acidimicrobiaceae bacterium]
MVVVGEDADRVGLVDGAAERGLGVSDSGQPDPEFVVLVDVIPVQGQGLVHVSQDPCDVHGVGFRRGRVVSEEVPPVVERAGQFAEVVGTDAHGVGEQHGPGEVVVVEQSMLEVRPPIVEAEVAGHLVQQVEARRQAGLQRVVSEEATGEAVEGGERGEVHVGQGDLGSRRRSGSPSWRATSSRLRRKPSASSAAAFSVKVMAAIPSTAMPS